MQIFSYIFMYNNIHFSHFSHFMDKKLIFNSKFYSYFLHIPKIIAFSNNNAELRSLNLC